MSVGTERRVLYEISVHAEITAAVDAVGGIAASDR